MLTALLPGLREVRGPLIIGYAYLFALYLLAGGLFDDPGQSSVELIRRIDEVFGLLGRAAALLTLSFAAYLLGVLVYFPSSSAEVRGVLRRIPGGVRRSLLDLEPGLSGKPYLERVRQERHLRADAKTQLTMNTSVGLEWGRLSAEADLRVNLALALIILSAICLTLEPMWVAAPVAIFAILLFVRTAPTIDEAEGLALEIRRHGSFGFN